MNDDGKLDQLLNEMTRFKIDILGASKTHWTTDTQEAFEHQNFVILQAGRNDGLHRLSTTFYKIELENSTSGMPQVCKLSLGVIKDMLPIKHIASKILTVVNYCGRQLARRLGWAAPAYHKKECATPHPGAWNNSLQYDG